MKSICIRVEDEIHRQLKCVLLYRGSTLQDFVIGLIEREIEREASEIAYNDTTGEATRLFQRVGIPTKL
mgnify:CR=1 FL=1